MSDFEKLSRTAGELTDFALPSYEALPEIDLYMDQVTGYLNKLLCRVCRSEDGTPLTPNRINNYVKGGHIDRPVQKKYDRDQIAMLYMLCCAKQNLSIPEASALLGMHREASTAALYEKFKALQENTVHACAAEIAQTPADAAALGEKALELMLRSTAERFMAEEIITALTATEAPVSDEAEKEKDKKTKKAKKQ
ncbi:MAG: DUF1836 domain-containing protein [Clostridia bacterium]|nr:DUF1836 domain-containing protein [Clostridia bacterium]